MTHIKLTKTEGLFAMIRSAEKTVDAEKEQVVADLKAASVESNPQQRDNESYVVHVDDDRYVIDPAKLKKDTKKIINGLVKELKPVKPK